MAELKISRATAKKKNPARNNPFDIVYTDGSKSFEGVIGKDNGFCKFDTLEHGARAGMKLIIDSYIKKGFDTVDSFVRRYSATDQEVYILYLANHLNVEKHEKIKKDNDTYALLGNGITIFEGQLGKQGLTKEYLLDIIKKFKIT